MKSLKFILMLMFLSVIAVMSIGCRVDKRPSKPRHPRPNNQFIGYSIPWDWFKVDPNQLAQIMDDNGLNLTIIELDAKKDGKFISNWIKPFRDRGIVVEIIIVNANSQDITSKPNSWFESYFQDIKKEVGPQGVLLEPVCEPGNRGGDRAKIQHWMDYGLKNWPGQTVINAGFEWSDPFLGRATYTEKHWCKDPNESNMYHGGRWIHTTDCGPTLGMNAQRAVVAVKGAIKTRSNFVLYDAHFDHSAPINVATIEAMGNEIK